MLYLIGQDLNKRMLFQQVFYKARVLVKVWNDISNPICVRTDEPHAFLFLDRNSVASVLQTSPCVRSKPCFLLEDDNMVQSEIGVIVLHETHPCQALGAISAHLSKMNCAHYIDDYAVGCYHDYRAEKNMKILGREVHFTPIQRMILRCLLHAYPQGVTKDDLMRICMHPGALRQSCNIPSHIHQINVKVEDALRVRFIMFFDNKYHLTIDETAEIVPPLPPKPMIDVVAALIVDNETPGPARFLVCQRPPQKARGLFWEFVGGKIEKGETPEEALMRECREELDIGVSVGKLFMEVTHTYSDVIVRLAVYRATIIQGIPQLLEHHDMKWMTKYDFVHYNFCPADADILRKICRSF